MTNGRMTLKNDMIGVGIIGANPGRGWAAMAHVPALQALPEFQITAISTSRRESAEASAAQFDVKQAFDNHAELVSCPDVDLVAITVKVPHHFELASAAIAAGKHVYCEWPLGNGLAEAEELARLAREQGVLAVVGLQSRSAPAIAHLRDLLRDNYVGEVLSTTLIGPGTRSGGFIDEPNAYTVDIRNGATTLTIPFGHTVDALNWVLGEFATLDATLSRGRDTVTVIGTGEIIPMTAHDQIVVSGVLESGAVAAVQYRASLPRGTKLLWEINGTEGDLRITSDGRHIGMFDLTLSGGRGEEIELKPITVPDSYGAPAAGVPAGFPVNVALTYAKLARDIREGTHLSATFDDAVVRHRMIHAVEAAAKTGVRQSYQK